MTCFSKTAALAFLHIRAQSRLGIPGLNHIQEKIRLDRVMISADRSINFKFDIEITTFSNTCGKSPNSINPRHFSLRSYLDKSQDRMGKNLPTIEFHQFRLIDAILGLKVTMLGLPVITARKVLQIRCYGK